MIKKVDKENSLKLMEINMKENIDSILKMEKEHKNTKMEIYL
jgi:hypothetical protein